MDTLNAGDTVSIGGKNYTIGGVAADVTDMLTKAGITDAAGNKVTINGKEYTYCENASDGKTALTNKGYYETAPDAANVATAKPAYANSAAIAAAKSATISVGTKSITTIDDTKAEVLMTTILLLSQSRKHMSLQEKNYLLQTRSVIPREMLK